jgi:hypothetical protein
MGVLDAVEVFKNASEDMHHRFRREMFFYFSFDGIFASRKCRFFESLNFARDRERFFPQF